MYPKWKELLGDRVELVLIQHKTNVMSERSRISNTLPSNRIELVEEWTKNNKFSPAEINPFDIQYPKYPNIPGTYLMAKEFLKRNGDLHLWSEDDAIVFDPNPEKWDKLLAGKRGGCLGKLCSTKRCSSSYARIFR